MNFSFSRFVFSFFSGEHSAIETPPPSSATTPAVLNLSSPGLQRLTLISKSQNGDSPAPLRDSDTVDIVASDTIALMLAAQPLGLKLGFEIPWLPESVLNCCCCNPASKHATHLLHLIEALQTAVVAEQVRLTVETLVFDAGSEMSIFRCLLKSDAMKSLKNDRGLKEFTWIRGIVSG
ncbi:unnamed protein product [Vicia faba]|uniref:Uncharacterized protein n=1 Tax=Vicia faba TaxID=3906 RepID=A0AAV1BBT0_VICFA|nr:unnamed protein product [Vicia faba]